MTEGTPPAIGQTQLWAAIIGVLNRALNLTDASSYCQMIAKGAVILLAALADMRGKGNLRPAQAGRNY